MLLRLYQRVASEERTTSKGSTERSKSWRSLDILTWFTFMRFMKTSPKSTLLSRMSKMESFLIWLSKTENFLKMKLAEFTSSWSRLWSTSIWSRLSIGISNLRTFFWTRILTSNWSTSVCPTFTLQMKTFKLHAGLLATLPQRWS